jgi:hypothetical protein
MPEIHLGFAQAPAILAAAATVLAFLVAWFSYRHTLPPVSRTTRWVLITLRATSLAVILLLLLEPLIRTISRWIQPPTLAVLIDNSQSMTIADGRLRRTDELLSIIRSSALRTVARDADLRFYTFGTRLRPSSLREEDTVSCDEPATDIAGTLQALQAVGEQHQLDAALLLSDGSYTVGQHPVHDAERLGFPLITVGIGDSSQQRDILISTLAANDLVYSDLPSPVDVTVRSSGFTGQEADVTLQDGSRVLDRTTLRFDAATADYPVHLTWVPHGEGVTRLTVHVACLNGELTPANNTRPFFTRVLRSKLRVLIVAGSPSPDLAVIRQTFKEDKNLLVRSFAQKTPSGFYEGPLAGSTVDSADCLVLLAFPTASTSESVLSSLGNTLSTRHTPVLFIAGPGLDHARLQRFGPVIPFTSDLLSSNEQLVQFEPNAAERGHPLLTLGTPEGIDAWMRLPPVFKTLSVYRARPEAIVLGTVRLSTGILPDPLLLARSVGRERSAAFLGYGLWRWRLMAQGTQGTADHLSRFLAGAVQWLTSREESKPVRVSPSQEFFRQGEPPEFVGQVYDASNRPVDAARVRLTVKTGVQPFETELRPLGNGRYEGSLQVLPEGDYTFQAVAEEDGISYGTDSGRFGVGGFNLEFQDTRMNAQLMRELAQTTGGEFLMPASIDSLPVILRRMPGFAPREMQQVHSVELWNNHYMLAILLAFLSFEWLLRKRSGML